MSSVSSQTFMRPDWDIVTASGSYWMQIALTFARERGIKFSDLQGAMAVVDKVRFDIRSRNPQIFYGVGHGLEDLFTGQNEQIILTKDNSTLMKGLIVHLLSCRTAKELGPELIKSGAKVYIGYDVDFYAVLGFSPTVDALYTRALFEPDITLALNLMAGQPPEKAFAESQTVSDEWIEFFRNSDDPYADMLIRALISNKNHLVVLTQTKQLGSKSQMLALALPLVALAGAGLFLKKKKKAPPQDIKALLNLP